MSIQFTQAIPTLRIFDLDKAKDYYVGFLGFQVDWEHRFEPTSPVFMQVSRGTLTLFLSEHHGDVSPGAGCFVWMTGLDEFHAEITSKGYRFMRPGIEPTFYGSRQMSVIDPFGNKLHFNEKTPEP